MKNTEEKKLSDLLEETLSEEQSGGTNSVEDMDHIREAMKQAKEYGLQYEVLCWAMYHLKSNPESTIAEALYIGMVEWDL